jgi:acetoin utilization protein AcuC
MFRSLRVKQQPVKIVADSPSISAEQLSRDAAIPITLRQINSLPENAKRRIYRPLLPPSLLMQFGIDPINWKGPNGDQHIRLKAGPEKNGLSIAARKASGDPDDILFLELADNAMNGIDLNLIVINDPESPRFCTDQDEQGQPTLFGTARRNLDEEERAMQAGLAPAQTRRSLRASRLVFEHLETFLATLGHRAYFLEPLTYASAWVFEQRGFAYVRGHKLMDDIHAEFQPGGRLHGALDGSTPFRQPDQWRTVRGRAWAIQDGILEVIDARWDGLRMVKQVGRQAGVETFPEASY